MFHPRVFPLERHADSSVSLKKNAKTAARQVNPELLQAEQRFLIAAQKLGMVLKNRWLPEYRVDVNVSRETARLEQALRLLGASEPQVCTLEDGVQHPVLSVRTDM
jgi:hypothetical protein